MAFERPTLAELVDRVEADFISRLELTGGVLRRSVVRVLARVVAGAAHMLHGHLEFLGKQLFPDLSAEAYLVRQAALFGLSRTEAGFATGTATVTGTNGTVIPEGTLFVDEDANEYETDAEEIVASGTATLALTAVLAGADGTLTAAETLSLESPIAGLDDEATVVESTVDGVDEETTEEFRVRLLEHMAEPAHGGTAADGIAWAKTVSGVTRAWVTPQELGAGTAVLRFVRDDDVSPIPSAGEVAEVQAVLDEEAPVHATWTAVAPTASAVDFDFASITPSTTAVKDAVEAELADLILREGEPGATLLLSTIRTAIGTAEGVTDYVLTTPAADVTHTTNQLPTMGTVTWP